MTTPTRHANLYTVAAADLPAPLRGTAGSPSLAIADPVLAGRLEGKASALPPGTPGTDRFRAAAEAAGVATAVLPGRSAS
jgi:hypothetical protein